MSTEYDLIVIGAGVLGTFHAYFGAKRGWKTLLIERNDFAADASVRNFGTLVPSAMSPGDWLRRGNESVEIYREIAAQTDIQFKPCGTLYPATTAIEEAILREFADLGPRRGYPCEFLDGPELRLRFVEANANHIRCGLYFPGDSRVEPRSLFRTLIPWMRDVLHVDYLPRTTAIGIESGDRVATVATAAGARIQAKQIVVCGGSDLRTLFPELLANAGLRNCKLQMCRVAPGPSRKLSTTWASGLTLRRYSSFKICPSWSKLAKEPVAPGILENGIHILIVQDADGSLVLGDSHEYSDGDLDDRYDSDVEKLIIDEARKLIDFPDWSIAQRWHGIYSLLPDSELFRASPAPRIHIVTGIGGKGMTTGPAVAGETINGLAPR